MFVIRVAVTNIFSFCRLSGKHEFSSYLTPNISHHDMSSFLIIDDVYSYSFRTFNSSFCNVSYVSRTKINFKFLSVVL